MRVICGGTVLSPCPENRLSSRCTQKSSALGSATEVRGFRVHKRINQAAKPKTKPGFLQLRIWVFSNYIAFYLFGFAAHKHKVSDFVDSRRLTLKPWEEILCVTAERHGWLVKFLICTGPRQWIFKRFSPDPADKSSRKLEGRRGSSSDNNSCCRGWTCWDCPESASLRLRWEPHWETSAHQLLSRSFPQLLSNLLGLQITFCIFNSLSKLRTKLADGCAILMQLTVYLDILLLYFWTLYRNV